MLHFTSFIAKCKDYRMKKQELIQKFRRLLEIENYTPQTIKSYVSALKSSLDYITAKNPVKVTVNLFSWPQAWRAACA